MEFTLYFIYYVSFAILSFVSLEIPSLRTSECDLFTTDSTYSILAYKNTTVAIINHTSYGDFGIFVTNFGFPWTFSFFKDFKETYGP